MGCKGGQGVRNSPPPESGFLCVGSVFKGVKRPVFPRSLGFERTHVLLVLVTVLFRCPLSLMCHV